MDKKAEAGICAVEQSWLPVLTIRVFGLDAGDWLILLGGLSLAMAILLLS
jgi:hypothetical protein